VALEPREVLELMGSAPERYESVRAALRYQGNGPTIKEVRERFWFSEAGRRTFGSLRERETYDPSEDPEPDGPFGWRCRLWLSDHHRWRLELDLPGGVHIAASTGRMRLVATAEGPPGTSELWERRIGAGPPSYVLGWLPQPTDTFWTMYPFDPHGICSLDGELEEMALTVEGPVTWAGREAVRLVGVPVEELEYPPEPLWWGADEYEVVVDAERGVLLRTASRLRGEDIDAFEVEEIHYNEPFEEEVFRSRTPLAWPS
jgi:hypothetical protein